MTFDQSSSSSHRTQRARSMATDTRKSRDTVHNRNYYSHEINTLPPLPTLDTSSPFHGPPHEVDLYSRPISPPLPASPISSIDPKRETKAVQRQKKEQMVLKLQQQQQTLEKLRLERQEKIERQQAKVERKHKRNEYRQMYHDQYNYQQQMEERRAEKRQQLSLPIYTTPTFSSTSSGNSSNTLLPPTNEIYYHSSRYYHRNRPSHQSREHCQHHHHDSLSSSNSGSSFRKVDLPDEKMRSLSLKSHSTKSMYDLRHWTGAPQSPTYDYHSGYDSDDTAMSHGWDSLMDTLHSPVIPSAMSSPPIISPGSESCFKDETDMDQLDSCLNSLSLSHEDCKNGNGRYLLD
ncbi:hypothetical protein BCR41DRAFT_39936 [Lobosporangium transversale]|uniref:Uncharacterized protein n=1 Tax=Lobosporangium transversale TaxID=64571 RepID=A0A1Y2GQM6_9FUNG|nr:hypothetical protein BCR41DRAFT_39936 [Lobosporangium transversale]ORZ19164.1 hypothetical protein BCR41DRAFT_39936 [Lobosporangium transversale]|eukprot:XP_021882332.1 hypothetical protein BCR41DRAFT_39936 [Lobosporangium transversale]